MPSVPVRTFEKFVLFCGRMARFACDGNCGKAWGISARPRVFLSGNDEDDYEYLADGELGEAPARSETTEGGYDKPQLARGAADMNRWCARRSRRSRSQTSRAGSQTSAADPRPETTP